MINKTESHIKMRDVITLNPSTPKMSDETEVTFLGMADVSENGHILKNNPKKYKDVCRGFTSFQDNDILVAKITPCFENGKGTLVRDTINGVGYGSTEFHVLRPSSKIDPYYLFSITQSHPFRVLGECEMNGSAGQKRVPADFIRDYRVFLPPLDEQQKIAKILRAWDDAIEKVDLLINKRKQEKSAFQAKIFSIKNMCNKWGKVPFRDIAIIQRGKFSVRPRNDPKIFGGSIPFIQTGDISRAINYIKVYTQTLNDSGLAVSKLFPKGTIMMGIAANVGDVAILDFDAACPDSVVGITPKNGIDSNWLFQILKKMKHTFESLSTQNAQKNLNLEKLEPVIIYTPSLSEQRKIANILCTCDDTIEKLYKYKQMLQSQKGGLMQKLLTGQWRVKTFNVGAI